MMQKETFTAIRALGLTVRKTEHGEYRVTVKTSNRALAERLAYYASDLSDALSTARAMSEEPYPCDADY